MNRFTPDSSTLHSALDTLLSAMAEAGAAHKLQPVELGTWDANGVGDARALQILAGPALHEVTRLDHPGFFAHMDPPTPAITWATAQWAAAMNQNLLHLDSGPAARQVEEQIIGWLAPEFGMSGGHMVPGSTVANLTALWAARDVAGVRRVVCSDANHVSVAKAAHILGLELVPVPVDPDQRLPLHRLPDDLSDAAVVLVAGTVATGAIDPLGPLDAGWVHVDAAWAGPLRFSSHAGLLDGVQAADSVGFSAHKWLYQPKESAVVLFANAESAHAAMTFGSNYLAVPNVGLLGSHSAAPALSLAATLLSWGREGVRRELDAAMDLSLELADAVSAAGLQVWRRPASGVVNWRVPGVDASHIQQRLRGAWVSTASIDGQVWLRSVAANPKADPQLVVDAVLSAR